MTLPKRRRVFLLAPIDRIYPSDWQEQCGGDHSESLLPPTRSTQGALSPSEMALDASMSILLETPSTRLAKATLHESSDTLLSSSISTFHNSNSSINSNSRWWATDDLDDEGDSKSSVPPRQPFRIPSWPGVKSSGDPAESEVVPPPQDCTENRASTSCKAQVPYMGTGRQPSPFSSETN